MSDELDRVDVEAEELKGGIYIHPDDVDDVLRRLAVILTLTSLALDRLEARGQMPAFTTAMRMVVPRVDAHTVGSGGGAGG